MSKVPRTCDELRAIKEANGVRVLDELPDGWRFNMSKSAALPFGYRWADNGKSRFGPGFEHAVVLEPQSERRGIR